MLGKFGKFAASPAGVAVAAFAALTAGIMLTVKALGSALKEFMKFEKGMGEVKSVMLGIDPSQIKLLTDEAKRLGATTAFTAEEASSGMAMLARAGFSASENIAALPAVLDLAAASGMTLSETADIVATAIKGFGLTAADATHVADVLAVGANSVNTTVADLGEAFQHVAPLARELGFSIEETTAMLATLQDQGVKSGKAGTGLRVVFASMGGEISKNKDALKQYLVEGHSFTENLETFQKLGVNVVSILQRMTEDTASLTTNMVEADDVVKQMAETRLDNLAGDITFFESAMSGLKIEVGEKLAPTFREFVQVATKFIGGLQAAFTHVMGGVEGSVFSTQQLMETFKVLGGVIFWVIAVVDKMYNNFMFGFNTLKMVMAGVLTAISGIIQAVVEVVAWGMNAVGLMSDRTYDSTVAFMRTLTVELAKTTGEAAVDAGGNFMKAYAGGAERDAFELYEVFADSMDGIGQVAGESLTGGMSEAIEEGVPKVTKVLEELTDSQIEIVEEGRKLNETLQKQIDQYGKTAAEILNAQMAEEEFTSALVQSTLALEAELQALKDKTKAEEEAIQTAEKLKDESIKLIESLRTPQEVYDDEKNKLQKMMDAKLLTIEQFDKALHRLRTKMDDDLEVNIITKGVIEGLQTALGTVNIAGQVSKTEQLAQKQVEASEKIKQVMDAVQNNTSQNNASTKLVADKTGAVVSKLSGTLTTDVTGLADSMGTVTTAINNISSENSMETTEQLLGTSNDLSTSQLTELQKLNTAIGNIGGGGGALT